MEKQIIGRGLLAGAVAGVAAFVFARTFVEPVIDKAIGYEEASAGGHDHGVELFSRGVQANIGMGFGVLGFSVAMGALFAVVYCVAYGRVGTISPRLLALLVAGGMFLSLYVIPFLKYPPSPPAVSLDETIRQRTLLYLLLVVLSAVLLAAAVWLGRTLAERYGAWSATLMAAAGYVVAVAVLMLALPTIDETPADFPADVLYEFRLYSLGTQVVMWAIIAVVFGSTVQRLLGEASARESYIPA
ncbi:cobalt transporter [Mycolicibacterium agri]|uniref:Cobalt transporter n=1 Tax=Mycolicibacterium agri TaxID=36811 RepID=A0A2A7NH37_MYCAG|nr:CbtA family protein [Mycolicibacterium agri]PEG43083.1 cobalt transporter [Mycolicibacterium agri]GFG54535.1 cobalt transporter [Mycolicibacterium agri]